MLEEVVANGYSDLLKLGIRLTGDAHLAEDLIQDGLTKAWVQARNGLAGCDNDSVRRYMCVAYTAYADRYLAQEYPVAAVPDDRGSTADDPLHRLINRERLRAAVGQLTRTQKRVMLLREYERRSEVEVARLLECTAQTVRSHGVCGRRRLFDAVGRAERVRGNDSVE
ncbi:MAG: hypothetical protein QOG53_3165 [Frankiales bacterium]|nr:hypothetical protein [Frankiales bacterium]